ncbi:uncharacterized protein H6S33_001993 [Morchella sextelata]|uniref:uncharacterized protein n=1 Tax=Morchella sextelata TaxID=1174677 RepID=UPI001D0505E0|nr:uncharacterized protein H6S33_001993 [Morchella sextelata]KAH0607941.1 hypothetical protein H6S33_001993 [Morchella sextelata]
MEILNTDELHTVVPNSPLTHAVQNSTFYTWLRLGGLLELAFAMIHVGIDIHQTVVFTINDHDQ